MPASLPLSSEINDSLLEVIESLRGQLHQFKPLGRETQSLDASIDRLLPGGGIVRGGIVECLGRAGDGAMTLSLWMARRLCGEEGMLAVVDSKRQLYPPAMLALGIDLDRTFVLHPKSHRDSIWALVQCLRCPSIAVVWSCIDRLDAREYRCLQLAAEASGVTGIFVRPTNARGQPTWADAQLLVTPQASKDGRRFAVEVVNCQLGASGKSVILGMDAITGEMREYDDSLSSSLAPQLANPSVGRRAARA